jgi:hypothetical protein
MYPKMNAFLYLLHTHHVSGFIVTDAQFPRRSGGGATACPGGEEGLSFLTVTFLFSRVCLQKHITTVRLSFL